MESMEDKIAVVERWLELVDNGKIPELVEQVDELFSEDFECHFATSMVKGLEAMREYARNSQSVYNDTRHEVIEHIVEGDKVATRMMWTGTQVGELLGIPPTGKRVTAPITNVYEVVDGKMRRTWIDYDSLHNILRQLQE